MTIYTRLALEIPWAVNGNIALPTTEKIEEGHIVEKPPCELMNFIDNRQDVILSYIYQEGIVEWDSGTEYTENAYIKFDGLVYKSLQQNINKQPDIEDENWSLAFDTYGSALAVQNIVDQIVSTDGYLTHYVRKSAPETLAKQYGTSYTANTGIPSSLSDDFGYGFNGQNGDSFTHNGTYPVVGVNGNESHKFKFPLSQSDNDNSVVTAEWVKQAIKTATEIAIGDLYLTTVTYINAAAVAAAKGYGTWIRFGEGKALVGYSSDATSSTPDWVKSIENTFGEYKHLQTIDEMASHTHKTGMMGYAGYAPESWEVYGSSDGISNDGILDQLGYRESKQTGGGQPFNVVQPSIVIYVWKRIA